MSMTRSYQSASHITSFFILSVIGILLQGCASTDKALPEAAPAAAITTPPAPRRGSCPEASTPPTVEPAPPTEPRSRFSPVAWKDLPDWGSDSLEPALTALLQSCS